jgi:hypothetical protein
VLDFPVIAEQLSSQSDRFLGALGAHADVCRAGAGDLADLGELLAHFGGVRHQPFGG